MSSPSTPERNGIRKNPERRPYDSPLRRQRAAETRERIVTAGSEIVHELSTWDWRNVTFRAIAERAGVSERTVYRHFATERELHDAVMHRLETEAGVSYEGIALDDLPAVTARVFGRLPSYAVSPWTTQTSSQPTLAAEDRRRRDALTAAVDSAAPDWSAEDRRAAAAMLDALWNVPTYERLSNAWQLDADKAIQTVGWAIEVLTEAIRAGNRPVAAPRPSSQGQHDGP